MPPNHLIIPPEDLQLQGEGSAQRGLAPFAEETGAHEEDVPLPPYNLGTPSYFLSVETEIEFKKGSMELTMDPPCFGKDRINIGVKGAGPPELEDVVNRSRTIPLSAPFLQQEMTSESRTGSDTEPEDGEQSVVHAEEAVSRSYSG
ncbi:hypothetical protein FRB90_012730 [Tulasnella sp. 427]|nr:hypothetical protein FRB90_012730 [Tulasnella sp. 427]